jgi:hypothetical protein
MSYMPTSIYKQIYILSWFYQHPDEIHQLHQQKYLLAHSWIQGQKNGTAYRELVNQA